MKRSSVLLVFLVVLAACSNPLLKWINTPETAQAAHGASAKAITSFSFGYGIQSETDEIRVVSPRADGAIPITVVLPAGSDPARLPAPEITFIGSAIIPPQGEGRDFTSPQTYTVYAEDGSVQKYEVEVLVKGSPPPVIKWFDLELPSGGGIMAEGVVTEGSAGQPGSIDIRVPSTTDLAVPLSAKVVQTGTLSGAGVTKAGDAAQTVTAVFSPNTPGTYTVKAGDGTTKEYKVTVSRILSDEKEITSFSVPVPGGGSIIGAEAQPDGKYPIVVTVPAGTDITALAPAITHTGVSITGPGVPSPGGPGTVSADPVDFTDKTLKPFTYTVTAEDGSTRDYVVTVSFASDSDPADYTVKAITSFYFESPLAIGEIDEAHKTITVTVPSGTDRGALKPTVFFTGKSLSPASGTTNNFNSPAAYTVTAKDNTSKSYEVRVVVKPGNTKEITEFSFSG
ncbi:MAG: DUF5018 domain-containing protein, partial [Treponema sp.]|nr:DUF5018 domain-containing protein [Treponema sp.]